MFRWIRSLVPLGFIAQVVWSSAAGAAEALTCSDPALSPSALTISADGKRAWIALAAANSVSEYDPAAGKSGRGIAVPSSPLGMTLSKDGAQLFVACAAPESCIAVIDTATATVVKTIPAGHTAMAPVLSPDGKTLYVCNRFNNEIAFIDIAGGQTKARVAVPREPVAAAVTHDGKFLLAANHLHAGRADADMVAAEISVIDTAAAKVTKTIVLPNGSGLLRDVQISPDGKTAAVTHLLSRFHLPTTQIERGWINTNALTLIDVGRMEAINTVLLDNIDSGAANPWAAAWTADGKSIVVTHAGTHELSVIDAPALLAKLAAMPAQLSPGVAVDTAAASHVAADVPNDLSYLVGLRRRVRLAETDRGPRALAMAGSTALVAGYFTDTITSVDTAAERPAAKSVPLGAKRAALTVLQKGELTWNDANICFQGWQSCSSCHSSDARVDGLNWDNLNDGIGNPKNAKSMLNAHRTPPSMWLGVRTDAAVSVRAGIRNSMFTVRPEEDALALDEYLKSLQPTPSPQLEKGKLSAAAERGKTLFFSETTGCADCHKGDLLTDMKFHNVGTVSKFDKPEDRFDTPSLIEIWRSGPYLHDGSAATLRDVLTTRNPKSEHGNVSQLTPEQINDLTTFLLSL